MANTGGRQQLKISPRKFSEKIALLNKKEAEGNAKFEEIIKEVQATRSGSSGCSATFNRDKHQQRDRKRVIAATSPVSTTAIGYDELEEVYEDLINCVEQYEQGLSDKGPQANDNNPTSTSQRGIRASEDTEIENSRRPASAAELYCHHHHSPPVASNLIIPANTLPLNQSQMFDINASGNNDLNHNSTIQEYNQQPTLLQSTKDNISGSNEQFYAQGVQDTCHRIRVTSIGSAADHQRYICTNMNQQPRYGYDCTQEICMENCVPDDMYLKPTCDRQKSSSDPALHAPSMAVMTSANTVSCSDNHLTMDIADKINSFVIKDDQQENIGPQADPNYLNQVAILQTFTMDNDSSSQDNTDKLNYLADIETSIGAKQQSIIMSINSQPTHHHNQQQYGSNDDDNNISFISHLPGIQICAIDDDNFEMSSADLDDCPNLQTSRDSSSPNIANQFNIVDKISNRRSKQTRAACGGNQYGSQGSERLCPEEECQVSCSDWTSQRLILNQTDSSLFDSFNIVQDTNWATTSDNNSNNGVLYPPKVNNLLSNSECGLTNQGLSSTDLCNNIIRSRSHNCIDHLMRQKIPRGSYSEKRHLQQRHEPLMSHQRIAGIPRRNQFGRLQVGGGPVKHCNSVSSMKPQRGSVSPNDSSSNLTSPQSEQNSPGSSTTEYSEYLPYAQPNNPHHHPFSDRRTTPEPPDEPVSGGGGSLPGAATYHQARFTLQSEVPNSAGSYKPNDLKSQNNSPICGSNHYHQQQSIVEQPAGRVPFGSPQEVTSMTTSMLHCQKPFSSWQCNQSIPHGDNSYSYSSLNSVGSIEEGSKGENSTDTKFTM